MMIAYLVMREFLCVAEARYLIETYFRTVPPRGHEAELGDQEMSGMVEAAD